MAALHTFDLFAGRLFTFRGTTFQPGEMLPVEAKQLAALDSLLRLGDVKAVPRPVRRLEPLPADTLASFAASTLGPDEVTPVTRMTPERLAMLEKAAEAAQIVKPKRGGKGKKP